MTEHAHTGLRCIVWAFSSCSKGRLLVVGLGFLIAVVSLVVEHRL